MSKLKCSLSKVSCSQCGKSSDCLIYGERKILVKYLKSMIKRIDDVKVIGKAILERK